MSQKFETLSIGAENPQNLRWIRIQGKRPGPAVLITAGIHGAEYVGIEAARRIARELNEQNVLGSVTTSPYPTRVLLKPGCLLLIRATGRT